MKITKILLVATTLSLSQSAFSFGLLGHIVAYSAAGVATHEVEKSIDKHDKQKAKEEQAKEYKNYTAPKQYGNNTYTNSSTSNSGYVVTPINASSQSNVNPWK
jgi:surface antigen